MSSVYNTEPPTSGKVIVVTNYGNIDIELWTKEAPRACRNFIQLCLEGYYNNCVFFRIIKGFMIQTGDPTNTGQGGESIWGKEFMDEFHSRLRFNHRGIVAMANRNKANTNGSQFFITMDKCQWLDKKHTIFGKIAGQTFFNALSISDVATKDDYPITETLPMIVKVEVILNPFIDIVPRTQIKKENKNIDHSVIESSLKEYKMKEKLKNSNLISFDDDEDEGDTQVKKQRFKIKPIHELVANDKKLVNKQIVNKDEIDVNKKDNEAALNLKDRIKQINDQQNRLKPDLKLEESEESSSSESEQENEAAINVNSLISKNQIESLLENDRKNEIIQLKKEILSIKKKITNADEDEIIKDEENKKLTPLQQYHSKFLHLKKGRSNNKDAVEKIMKFKDKLKSSKNESDNWMSNKLKFHVDSQKAFAMNETNEKILKGFDLSISMNK
jgi:peptidyl-prolyl cis-trans isomerase SDCCAG10